MEHCKREFKILNETDKGNNVPKVLVLRLNEINLTMKSVLRGNSISDNKYYKDRNTFFSLSLANKMQRVTRKSLRSASVYEISIF